MRQARVSSVIGPVLRWRPILGLAVGALAALLPGSTQTAVANGDTRTISLYHAHTRETITATFLVNGQYDQAVLDKLNWFLRDWRRDEPTKMDPHLFDVVWEVYRESGSQQPIEVMSAYRSPETNAMLRRRSRQVAEHSQHILGRAMDQHYMDVPMSRIRELGMKLQQGGVGFYPTAGTPFVHLDVGGVRHWPRMSYDQLARLFPDGKTVHIPSNGQPLSHYEEARAELGSRGGSYPTASEIKSKGFFAWLFGGGGDEDEDNAQAGGRAARGTRVASAGRGGAPAAAVEVGNYGSSAREGATQSFFASQPPKTLFGGSRTVVAQAPEPAPPQFVARAPDSSARETLATAMATPAAPAALSPAEPIATLPVPAKVMADAEAAEPPVLAAAPVVSSAIASLPGAPLPPRRPTELAALGPNAPVPPMRPSELAGLQPHDGLRPTGPGSRSDSIGALLGGGRMARLPDVIVQGTTRGSMAMSYAAQPSAADDRSAGVPLPVARPAALLSTHLDRSNFRSLTGPDKTERSPTRSALGSVVPPVRAAAADRNGGARAATFGAARDVPFHRDRLHVGPVLRQRRQAHRARRHPAYRGGLIGTVPSERYTSRLTIAFAHRGGGFRRA